MSYILDALQRAHAQRELGAVPGLHTPPPLPMLPTPPPAPQPRGATPRWVWVGAAMGAVLAALVVVGLSDTARWWPLALPATDTASTATTTTTATATATEPAAKALPAPETPPAHQAMPAPAAPISPVPINMAPPQPAPQPAPQPPRAPPAVAAATPAAAAPTATPVAPAAAPVAPAVAATPAPVVWPLLGDLAQATRREVPPLAITGAVYASTPSQRLLIVNNQVLTEGATVAPGVTLEEIQPNQSIFSVKGQRFRLPH